VVRRSRTSSHRKITAGQRLAAGLLIAVVAAVLFLTGQTRFGLFAVGAVFFPYLAFIAPFRCNNPKSKSLDACMNNGWGLLFGCNWHRLDTIRRIFRRHPRRYRPARMPRTQTEPTQVAYSGGIPEPAVGTVTFRRKVFDVLGFGIATLGTIAGWLALVIDPGA
jgi:hypothetical protein